MSPLLKGRRGEGTCFGDPLSGRGCLERCAAPRARMGGTRRERPLLAGGHGRGGTPGPVPNPEVKPPSADGTADQSVGEQDAAAQQGAFSRGGPSSMQLGGPFRMRGRRVPGPPRWRRYRSPAMRGRHAAPHCGRRRRSAAQRRASRFPWSVSFGSRWLMGTLSYLVANASAATRCVKPDEGRVRANASARARATKCGPHSL